MTLSLRARLLLGLVALVVVGILVADLATYASLKTFLYQRVDKQLTTSDDDVVHQLNSSYEPHGPGPGGEGGPAQSLPAGTYAAVLAPDGSVVADLVTTAFPGQTPTSARPVLPRPSGGGQAISTVAGRGGIAHYELLVEPLYKPPGDYLAIAIPLTDVDSTLAQLVQLELLIGVLVVLAAALLGLLLVRVGLQPLARMGTTASAIAGGDLSRRVEPATPRTEIGRLGLALNAMLTQIEAAFAERTASNQRLRRFLADASHELRTPLTSIRGYAEILRRGAESKPEDSALARRRIEEEAVRMTALVDDLLLLARLDQGRPLARETVDLQALVQDAETDALAVAPNRPLRTLAPERVVITGDAMRLRQVLGNLVRNALVHTPADTPVELSLRQVAGKAVVKVADHGPGLPPGVGERVFEPFFRADAGRSRDRGGAGLGLSIVAAVVAAHGGAVHVESTPGGGATFVVELPLYPPPLPAEAPSAPARVASTQPA
ncbi:MAG TPA: HAMP domain-containing sensor histidine kinase [Candidatus Dormibacteraeota bacterium]